MSKKRVMQDKVIIYSDKSGDFRWKRVSSNGRIVGASSEGFTDKRNCLRNFKRGLEKGFFITEE